MKYLVGILVLWPNFGHAIAAGVTLRDCENELSQSSIDKLTAELNSPDVLNSTEVMTIRLRLKTPAFDDLDYKQLRDGAKRLNLWVRDFEARPSASMVNIGFNVNGFAGDIATFIDRVMLDARPRSSLWWMKPAPRRRGGEASEILQVAEPQGEALNQLLRRAVSELLTPTKARALNLHLSVYFVGDLVHLSHRQVARVPNWGPKTIREVEAALSEKGLRLGMDIPGWPFEDLPYPRPVF